METTIDYAQMLEIPVSTVQVNRKKGRQKKTDALKEETIDSVNERLAESDAEPSVPPTVTITHKKNRASEWVLVGEFIAACLLLTTVFLTNLFYTDSAINTFLRSLTATANEQTDERVYSDFTLSGVMSERCEAEIAVTSGGVMSFTAKTAVYPVCDGTVERITGETGNYTVEIKHSEYFKSVLSGLTTVYSQVGDSVKGNLPVAYSDGTSAVRVMLYAGERLINTFTVNDDNLLVWS